MKTKLSIIALALLFVGCASFKTTQTQLDTLDESGKILTRQTSTKASAFTFFSAKSSLATWKAQQTDKSQGATVGDLSQNGGIDTNMVSSVVNAAITAAVRATIKP